MYAANNKTKNIRAELSRNVPSQQPFFQPKLTINQPNDIYEQEADAMADKVMRMSDTSINNNSFFKPAITPVQRKCAHCEEEKNAQRKEESNETVQPSSHTENYINNLSGGKPLENNDKHFFESRIGYDFSNVRLHTGNVAAKSAKDINALAYTSGNNIVFGSNQYQPHTESGKRLMAHELTHVVQQNSGVIQPKLIQRYTGCSSAQDTIVTDDHNRARDMLRIAIANISSYDGTNPAKVHDALATHFNGATSNRFATWINLNLRILRGLTWMAGYNCFSGGVAESRWACTGRDLATTFWCVPGINIRLCASYFSESDIERSTTMIHEWVHKYGCNFDLGYEHEEDYGNNSTAAQLLNADSFSNLIRDVQ